MKECFLEIDAAKLAHNFNWYKSKSDFVCPMIKANAYGVGEKEVFQILKSQGAKTFGVVRLSEALSVRSMDERVNILMFNPIDEQDVHYVLQHRITPVISNLKCLTLLNQAVKKQGLNSFDIHIELDTGMNRLGFKSYNLPELFNILKSTTSIRLAGVFSHFLAAEDWPNKEGQSFKQFTMFNSFVEEFKKLLKDHPNLESKNKVIFHMSSSKALNDNPDLLELNKELLSFGVRPGLGLYGVSQNNQNLKKVLSLKAPIIDLKWVFKGETVSYDGIWQAEKTTLIGLLPLGYADGFPRSLTKKACVNIEGHLAPVLGKICMDFIMIDLSYWAHMCLGIDLSSLTASDLNSTLTATELKDLYSKTVTIFGDGAGLNNLSLESVCETAGLTTYEFLARLSPRIQRRVIGI